MPKKPDTDGSVDQAPSIDPQKKYLMDQFGGLMEKVGDGFGVPLQEELVRRLEQTIADFHEEVTELLDSLKENSEKRHEKLKEIWSDPDTAESSDSDQGEDGNGEESGDDSGGEEMSDWEKRIEGMESGKGEEKPPAEEPKKQKKGLFGRKKK